MEPGARGKIVLDALKTSDMDWLARLETPQNALAILTAMITPAVLISACGALIFSTSTRLGRVVDRVRDLSAKFQELAANPEKDEMFEERRALIFTQLDRQTSRARLIQRAMAAFYTALGRVRRIQRGDRRGVGGREELHLDRRGAGTLGSLFMLCGSALLIVESRMALASIMSEMDFVWKVSTKYAARISRASRAVRSPGSAAKSSSAGEGRDS